MTSTREAYGLRAPRRPSNEVVHGELLVTPAPRVWHQELAWHLGAALRRSLEREPVGHALALGWDISWWLDHVLVEPDVLVAPLDQF